MKDFVYDGVGEECGVFDDDIVIFVFEWNIDLFEEKVGRFVYDYGGEELVVELGIVVGSDVGFEDGDFEVGVEGVEDVGVWEIGWVGVDDGDVGFGVGV